MEFSNLIGIGIAGVTTLAVASNSIISPEKKLEPQPRQPVQTSETNKSNSPHRLSITVSVTSPEDLKVKEGQQIKAGDIISDRSREKTRLVSQQQQLKLSLDRLKSASIAPPIAPAPVPTINALPPISYLEYEAAVEKTKAAIANISSELDLKKQEIDYLSKVPNLDPIVLEHEETKLADLKRNHTAAVREYQLAMGKLQTAKDSRKYQEYEASVTSARRVEEMNQSRLNYQRSLSDYEEKLANKEFQTSQLQAKLNEVDNAIASLSIIKAPYSGTIRRIKWLGQSPDGSLTAEVTVMVRNREQKSGIRDQGTVNSDQTKISLS
jgi:multidrug efflux pump subunit AcrA (membrane-fusion protein)